MRIALVSTTGTPVRQGTSGSIEAIVWLLGRELTRLGHPVTTFAVAGSRVFGELVETLPGPYGKDGSPGDWELCEWINLCRAVEDSARFDLLHSHAYLWGLPLQPLSRAPMVHTMHILPQEDTLRLCAMWPDACITAISHYQWSLTPQIRPIAVIPHAIDAEQFTFSAEPEDYVCFLGRFTPDKGALTAIAAARRLGLRLVLAGGSNPYFRAAIEPEIDGRLIEYAGPMAGPARDRLLGGARALVYPIEKPEPFGLVLAEAMTCGTPVAAVSIGAVPELVDEGVTGCCAASPHELDAAILKAMTLDRRAVHQRAVERFSAERMASAYVSAYQDARRQWPLAMG